MQNLDSYLRQKKPRAYIQCSRICKQWISASSCENHGKQNGCMAAAAGGGSMPPGGPQGAGALPGRIVWMLNSVPTGAQGVGKGAGGIAPALRTSCTSGGRRRVNAPWRPPGCRRATWPHRLDAKQCADRGAGRGEGCRWHCSSAAHVVHQRRQAAGQCPLAAPRVQARYLYQIAL